MRSAILSIICGMRPVRYLYLSLGNFKLTTRCRRDLCHNTFQSLIEYSLWALVRFRIHFNPRPSLTVLFHRLLLSSAIINFFAYNLILRQELRGYHFELKGRCCSTPVACAVEDFARSQSGRLKLRSALWRQFATTDYDGAVY